MKTTGYKGLLIVRYDFRRMFSLGFVLCLPVILLWACQRSEPSRFEADSILAKPWTRWWWMGSAVSEKGITAHLEAFKLKGLGGVEIVPIYGERGDEENFIPYLSDKWIDMLLHTLREADRLGIGVDMTLGSGWPYGGPWITEALAARKYDPGSDVGILTRQSVKRAAPGAEGLVVDHLSPEAMQHFLARFDSLMDIVKLEDLPLRAIFNDSYEVYGADWTPRFKDIFLRERGYPFPETLLNNPDSIDPDLVTSGYWQDYHKTINDLIMQTAGYTIRGWSKKHDVLYRYQAHGSPANLLDLYGLASIPETECFGSSRFNIPGVDYDPDYSEAQFGRPHPLIYKFASSPAHIQGKALVSAETATWLADHFKVSLSQIKPQVDELFVSGINHILYHGIAYSPFEKEFPGRLFYASTNLGPSSNLWEHLDDLNDYIKSCQAILQHTNPDNDILLYFPVYDLWDGQGNEGNLVMQGVHNPDTWLFNTPFGVTAQKLYDAGYTFDYVSDQQLEYLAGLATARASGQGLYPNGHSDDHEKLYSEDITTGYKVVIIPETTYMPPETAKSLQVLQEKGTRVFFLNSLPGIAPGFYERENRTGLLKTQLRNAGFDAPVTDEVNLRSPQTQGLSKSDDQDYPDDQGERSLSQVLLETGIRPEGLKEAGLSFIRKSHAKGYVYFISNLTGTRIDNTFSLARPFKAVEIYDPLSGDRGKAGIHGSHDGPEIRIRLEPGKSLFLITYNTDIPLKPWHNIKQEFEAIELGLPWKIGIKDKLENYVMDTLRSWTELPFDWAPFYSGKATYVIEFDFDVSRAEVDALVLDLGDLRHMATAILNDAHIGDFWCVPFTRIVPLSKVRSRNTLVLEVTNLDANRIIQMDREKIPWKNFYEINFVNIRYEPFDASNWDPLPSGVLGPVRLIPVSMD